MESRIFDFAAKLESSETVPDSAPEPPATLPDPLTKSDPWKLVSGSTSKRNAKKVDDVKEPFFDKEAIKGLERLEKAN